MCAGEALQEDTADMSQAADAGTPLRGLCGIRLQPGDQLAQVPCRHRFLCHHHVGEGPQQRQRLEVVHHVVRKRVENTVGHMRGPLPYDERIAITGRAGYPAGTDTAVCTSYVFNYD